MFDAGLRVRQFGIGNNLLHWLLGWTSFLVGLHLGR